MTRSADEVMVDYGHGLSNFDPYDEMAVLIAEVVRVRAALAEAVRRADQAEARLATANLNHAEWVSITTNEMAAERAQHEAQLEELRKAHR